MDHGYRKSGIDSALYSSLGGARQICARGVRRGKHRMVSRRGTPGRQEAESIEGVSGDIEAGPSRSCHRLAEESCELRACGQPGGMRAEGSLYQESGKGKSRSRQRFPPVLPWPFSEETTHDREDIHQATILPRKQVTPRSGRQICQSSRTDANRLILRDKFGSTGNSYRPPKTDFPQDPKIHRTRIYLFCQMRGP